MEYDDDEKFTNYMRILKAIETIENERVTEDWIESHKDWITLYREWIYDYSTVNEEIKDPQFRKMASSVETLLNHLLRQVYGEHTFDPDVYLLFNQALKFMAEYTMEKDELASFMERMAI